MQTITTIGFDIAKSVFQVHGVDAVGQVIVRRQLKRRQVIAFFQKPAACPGPHRGVRLISLLVARAPSPWSQGAADATGLREALRQATEERYGRC
jgi:transposase